MIRWIHRSTRRGYAVVAREVNGAPRPERPVEAGERPLLIAFAYLFQVGSRGSSGAHRFAGLFVESRFFADEALAKTLHHDVDGGDEEEIHHRRHDHPAEHGRPQRMAALRARSGGDDQRKDAENEGKGRHEDRAQALFRCFQRGVRDGVTLRTELGRELDDENGILGRQANQHDEPDLAEHVVDLMANELCEERAYDAERDGQEHDERQAEALVLRREDQENENERERKDEQRRVARFNLFFGDTGPFEGHALREGRLGDALHLRHPVPSADALRG